MFNIAVTETDSALVTRVVVMISMCLKAWMELFSWKLICFDCREDVRKIKHIFREVIIII